MTPKYIWTVAASFLLMLPLSSFASSTQTKRKTETLKHDDGKQVRLTTDDIPSLSSLRPLLLVIPAKKYLSNGEIFERMASLASPLGVYVARFDWSFPYDGLSKDKEAELARRDIELVLRQLKKRPFLDSTKTFVLAKSFGATVFAESFRDEPVAGVFFLTPNCDESATFTKRFGMWFTKGIPVRAAISVEDPYCDVAQMYQFQGQANKSLHTFQYFYGDHNFSGKTRDGIDAVVHSIVEWVISSR